MNLEDHGQQKEEPSAVESNESSSGSNPRYNLTKLICNLGSQLEIKAVVNVLKFLCRGSQVKNDRFVP